MRGVAPHEPARIAGIGCRIIATAETRRRNAVEVIERLRQTGSDARPLQEGAVRAERQVTHLKPRVVGVDANVDIGARRAVSSLLTSVCRDIAAGAEGFAGAAYGCWRCR